MTFVDVAARFGKARPPEPAWPDPWVSPYRLLWGAAFSIGTAEPLLMSGASGDIPLDLSPALTVAVEHPGELPWFHKWEASYLLTNAIFRVAAAAEKICGLATDRPDDIRVWLAPEARRADSRLSTTLPLAHALLKGIPNKDSRGAYLRGQREEFFTKGKPPTPPLVCAFLQTDTDKHVPYAPLKELSFDSTLAATSFLEACDLWDAAAALAQAH